MTPTAIACAMRDKWLCRGLLIATLALFSRDAIAQRRPVASTPAPAGWDSLYGTHRIFELRDSIQSSRATISPSIRFYRGIVAHAFNDNDAAIADLAPLVDSAAHDLTAAQLVSAADALGDCYRREFRYRESAATYRRALRITDVKPDTATRARLMAWVSIADALADVPPQRIAWSAESNNAVVPNDSVQWAMAATINGDTLGAPLAIDPGARLTILDSTTAAAHRVQPFGATVHVIVAGHLMSAHIGAISALGIGSATISNVAVLIVEDDSLRAAYNRESVSGVIGLPVASALGTITLTRDGQIALSSPGTDNDTGSVANMALADGATIAAATYAGRRIPVVIDPAAKRTLLYPPFLQEFVAAAGGARLTTYVGRGLDGGIVSLPAYVIPDFVVSVSDRSIRLGSIDALMRSGDPRSQLYFGALGQDALQSADRATLDFSAMTLRLRDEPPQAVLPKIVYPTGVVGGSSPVSKVPQDIAFVALLFALFVVPKALQRYRLPSAITSLLMGAGATALGLFHNDPTLHLLSTFGIVALFLFAGLEIDGHELKRQASPLILHGLVWSVLLAIGTAITSLIFGFAIRPAVLIALALLTPSTGFILSSLAGFGLHTPERFAVKTYAIASELLALTVLFFVLQSTSIARLAFAVAAMLGVVIVIPVAFRLFARLVAPHAPRSEFAFLLMVAIVCSYATTRLGVYYLVGAFLVGIAAQRFRSELPAMSSEKMVDALESFGSVFIPFYFFHAGTEIVREQITVRAMIIGLILIIVLIPCRIAITTLQRRLALRDSMASARRVGIALVPTLVFTLVITDILNTKFGMANYVLGALVLYTVINTSIPAFVLHSAPPEFENVEAAEIESEAI
jgi:Kef-type K+ transport system membrane component KefB